MICKVIKKDCANTPICAYKDNDYELPEIFGLNCEFYRSTIAETCACSDADTRCDKCIDKEIKDAENANKAVTEVAAEEPKEEEAPTPAEYIEAAVNSVADEIAEYEGSLSKYPAKKGRKSAISDETKEKIVHMYEIDKIKPMDIAKKVGLGKSTVYNIIKEHLGMEA